MKKRNSFPFCFFRSTCLAFSLLELDESLFLGTLRLTCNTALLLDWFFFIFWEEAWKERERKETKRVCSSFFLAFFFRSLTDNRSNWKKGTSIANSPGQRCVSSSWWLL